MKDKAADNFVEAAIRNLSFAVDEYSKFSEEGKERLRRIMEELEDIKQKERG